MHTDLRVCDLQSLGLGYLKSNLLCYQLFCALCSALEAVLVLPPAGVICLLSPRRRAFSLLAPTLWNSLPLEARLVLSGTSFCHCVEMKLFQCGFSGRIYGLNVFLYFDLHFDIYFCCIVFVCKPSWGSLWTVKGGVLNVTHN